jgi:hypothetical protein
MRSQVSEVNGPARSIAEIGLAVDILAQANQVWLKRCDGHISGSSRLIDGLIVQMIQLVLDLRFFHSIDALGSHRDFRFLDRIHDRRVDNSGEGRDDREHDKQFDQGHTAFGGPLRD